MPPRRHHEPLPKAPTYQVHEERRADIIRAEMDRGHELAYEYQARVKAEREELASFGYVTTDTKKAIGGGHLKSVKAARARGERLQEDLTLEQIAMREALVLDLDSSEIERRNAEERLASCSCIEKDGIASVWKSGRESNQKR